MQEVQPTQNLSRTVCTRTNVWLDEFFQKPILYFTWETLTVSQRDTMHRTSFLLMEHIITGHTVTQLRCKS